MGIVVIGQDGRIQSVHDDALAEALHGFGKLDIRRASQVEYDNQLEGWVIEMLEYGGFFVGPFRLRASALAWEVAYLEKRLSGFSDSEASLAATQVSDAVRLQ